MPVGRPLTLYCFAHAGAGASCFHRWRGPVGDGVRVVPVALPGRLGRRAARLTGRDEAVAALLPRLGPLAEPFAFYGHSLGGLIAYTLARALDTPEGRPPRPAFVAIGACAPPDAPALLPDGADPGAAPEPDALLRRLTGAAAPSTGAELIDGDLWRRAVLPVLRDDLRLAAALRTAARSPATGGPLSLPLLVAGGADDELVPPEMLGGWRHWTTGPFVRRTVPGDHFFVRDKTAPALVGRACRVALSTARTAAGATP
ncbi:thioesterase II family protein [Streptomyces sp. NPDC001709]